MRLALGSSGHHREFVVIGGLNPDFLAPHAQVGHLGTTDVDVLLQLGMPFDRDDLDFGWLEEALGEGVPTSTRWQWRAESDPAILIELLCDESDSPGLPVDLPGSSVTALNVRGAGPAMFRAVTRSLSVSDDVRTDYPQAPATVDVAFAGLGGYLLAKSVAIVSRGLEKDSYDLAFVMLGCDGGPAGAAKAIGEWLDAGYGDTHRAHLRNALDGFIEAPRAGASAYARQMAIAGSTDDFDVLIEDAATAAGYVRDVIFN